MNKVGLSHLAKSVIFAVNSRPPSESILNRDYVSSETSNVTLEDESINESVVPMRSISTHLLGRASFFPRFDDNIQFVCDLDCKFYVCFLVLITSFSNLHFAIKTDMELYPTLPMPQLISVPLELKGLPATAFGMNGRLVSFNNLIPQLMRL